MAVGTKGSANERCVLRLLVLVLVLAGYLMLPALGIAASSWLAVLAG
jgi:hypothetical protein